MSYAMGCVTISMNNKGLISVESKYNIKYYLLYLCSVDGYLEQDRFNCIPDDLHYFARRLIQLIYYEVYFYFIMRI